MNQDINSHKIDTSRVQRICRTDLTIPIGAEVVIHAVDQKIRFSTTFIGLIKNKYLLLHRPDQRQKLTLSPNEHLAVRYIAGSQIFGFSTTLAAIIAKPYPIIFIDHPECYETLNLRQDDRIKCFQPVTIFKDSEETTGKVTDISKSGCRIIINKQEKDSAFADLKVSTDIFCTLQLPENDNELYTKGIIRVVEQQKDKIRMGVQFIDLDENVQNSIERYIATTLEYMEGV